MAADVVVFDPATVTDKATYEDPFQYPVGISAVIVNGSVALRRWSTRRTGTPVDHYESDGDGRWVMGDG